MMLSGLEITCRGNLEREAQGRRVHLRRTMVDMSAAFAIAIFVVWSVYAFHFAATPRSAVTGTSNLAQTSAAAMVEFTTP
jgi:hypothetical protein